MSYHRITVIGYVGSDPEHQVTPTGKDVSVFPLYVNERFGDNERTARYKIKAWSDLSAVVKEHLLKGQLLIVEGSPSVEVWESSKCEPRAQLVVTAQMLRFLGAKPSPTLSEEDST
jgi:single-stranded DNA-binding protein